MKLIRFGPPGAEKPGLILPDGARLDASGFGSDWDERFLGGDGIARLAAWAQGHGGTAPRVPQGERLGPPIVRPSKIVCIGLNYADHARETGAKIPEEPIIFFKATTALCGPNDDLVLPRGSAKTDWEVELAVVIGGGSLNGGEGSILGSMIGALVMAFLRNGSQQMGWPTYVQEILIGVIIVVAVAVDRWRHAQGDGE